MESALLAKFFIREEQKPTVNEKKFRHPATKQLIQMVADDITIPIGLRAAILVVWDGMLRASEYCLNTASTFNPKKQGRGFPFRKNTKGIFPASAF